MRIVALFSDFGTFSSLLGVGLFSNMAFWDSGSIMVGRKRDLLYAAQETRHSTAY